VITDIGLCAERSLLRCEAASPSSRKSTRPGGEGPRHNVLDLCERLDERRRAARDLSRLKPDERRALGLLALGYSYKEICAITGWTYTKRNGCQVPATASRPLRHRRNDAPVLLLLRQ
jgi:hypothetical protein